MKHGGGNIRVWGYFTASGTRKYAIIHSNANSASYQTDLWHREAICVKAEAELEEDHSYSLWKALPQKHRVWIVLKCWRGIWNRQLNRTGLSCTPAPKEKRDIWFERWIKEATYVHCDWPSVNRRGGLWHQLTATYNADPWELTWWATTTTPSWPFMQSTFNKLIWGDNSLLWLNYTILAKAILHSSFLHT